MWFSTDDDSLQLTPATQTETDIEEEKDSVTLSPGSLTSPTLSSSTSALFAAPPPPPGFRDGLLSLLLDKNLIFWSF